MISRGSYGKYSAAQVSGSVAPAGLMSGPRLFRTAKPYAPADAALRGLRQLTRFAGVDKRAMGQSLRGLL